MAIGIFGGSFDPIHIGHLITTLFVKEKRNLDKIFFVPSFISPLKQNHTKTNELHRLKMVELAIENVSGLFVSDFELKQKKISYTIDTINEFKKYYDEIELIIGYDNFLVFDKWHKPDEILSKAKVLVMKRQNELKNNINNIYKNKMIFIDTPIIEISSTDIRNRIKQNLSVDFFLPEKVKDYILKNGLYK